MIFYNDSTFHSVRRTDTYYGIILLYKNGTIEKDVAIAKQQFGDRWTSKISAANFIDNILSIQSTLGSTRLCFFKALNDDSSIDIERFKECMTELSIRIPSTNTPKKFLLPYRCNEIAEKDVWDKEIFPLLFHVFNNKDRILTICKSLIFVIETNYETVCTENSETIRISSINTDEISGGVGSTNPDMTFEIPIITFGQVTNTHSQVMNTY